MFIKDKDGIHKANSKIIPWFRNNNQYVFNFENFLGK